MLSNLTIDNIAVIEHCEVEFTKGLNILTGETGAGKSIIIDAINAIRGERTNKDLIRYGQNVAKITAIFSLPYQNCDDILQEYGISQQENKDILIQRDIFTNGRNVCRVNSSLVTTNVLKDLTARLITIHGQYDNQNLLNPAFHLEYIDLVGDLQQQIEQYKTQFYEAVKIKKELDKLNSISSQRNKRVEILSYEIDEIKSANIVVGEKKQLLEKKKRFQDYEKIVLSLNRCKSLFDGNDEENGIFDKINELGTELDNMESYSQNIASLSERVSNIQYELEDIQTSITDSFDDIDFSQDDIEQIEFRLEQLHKLFIKYGDSEEIIISYLSDIEQEYEQLTNLDESTEKLEKEYKIKAKQAMQLAEKLSQSRKDVAQKFVSDVKDELKFLDMPNLELVADFQRCKLSITGCDTLQFLISTNIGELPKPIAKVASGGELSRIMLAIKNVLADKDEISTLIFDEVDTGISGYAAQKVGKKLQEIAKNKQILCVTHLAQVSAHADSHYLIKKNVEDNKTFTKITRLNYYERISELSRIMNGSEMTKSQYNSARELLDSCRRKN